MWITAKEYRKKYGISSQHFYALRKAGKLQVKRLFDKTFLVNDTSNAEGFVCVYARVSTPKQRQDLENQLKFLKEYAVKNGMNPQFEFADIASGMSERRKGLNAMIDAVTQGKISKVLISHKDRLTRFGYGYLENVFNRYGAVIEVVNLEDEKSFQEELTEDLIAIIHHFSMKFYGKRKNDCRQLEKILTE